ncbi:Hypothetical predicted protein [Pelobates cultripes]|uniref:Sushi domain-containing protein n=1 Tax=Pelobates cultripes TaxID=61616 RepID=A0AAD1SV67_PELCU|nr:Hypothetical predicted protein [Pelobates cultripes]
MLLLGYFVLLAVGLNCNAAPVPCGPPPRDSEFELQGTLQESYPPGTTLTFNCRPGYSHQGSIKKVCADGNWASIAQGVCKRKSCGHPGDIEFGTFDLKEGDGFVFGAVVEYSCDEGYQMVSKQRTRECTATGWSHYPPHCEVRKCPPVEATTGVKVITTSYDDEEFSVGQVVKFQCQDPKLKLDGLSEIFCTSEGTWSADPPQCTTITCKEPTITNGRVENPRAIYNEGEKLPFKCNKKYKPYRSEDVICKANGWSPEPLCEDISCYPDYVANGKVEKTKEIYKEGDTIVLNCNYGYQIEFSPDKPRKCTANGWFPPLKCISETFHKVIAIRSGTIRTFQYITVYVV